MGAQSACQQPSCPGLNMSEKNLDNENDPIKMLPPSADEPLQPTKESFLRRAFNRTKEAIRNVDEAITGREAARRIEERFQKQAELNEMFIERFDESFNQTTTLRSRLDNEINALVDSSAQQRALFEKISAEITETATELRFTATQAEESLTAATNQQLEMQKQAAGQLARWNNDSESLKNDVRALQGQLAQLQQSFKQFVITALVCLSIMAILIVYLFFHR